MNNIHSPRELSSPPLKGNEGLFSVAKHQLATPSIDAKEAKGE